MKWLQGKSPVAVLARFAEDREEYRKVSVLFIYLLFVASASTVGRTAADALFLSHFDSSLLSKMYLPQSAALILAGLAFQRFGLRVRIDRFIGGLIPSLTLLVGLSRLGVGLGFSWVLPVIYVAFDVFNFLMVVCFWQFAACLLDQRKVKRTIGLVGSGGIVGGIVSGFGLKLIVPWTGTANLIVVYAALQLLALAAVMALVRRSGDPAEVFAAAGKPAQGGQNARGKTKKRQEKEAEGLFRSVPHLKYVAIMSAALILALTFVDYQFKVILKGELGSGALAGFMGSFYGIAGLLALTVQVFVAGRLLTRFGVMTAILVFPVVLLTGSVGVLLFPVLAMSVLVKGSDKVVGDTINSSVNQLIMFPIPPQWRNKAKSFLDGIVRNGAKGLAAISLIVLSPLLSAREFSFIIIGLLIVCIAAAVKVKGAYLRTLLATLQTDGAKPGEAELDLMDPASVQLLAGALAASDKQQSLYAFRMLSGMDGYDLSAHIPQLLAHPSREVVIEALDYMGRRKPEGLEGELAAVLVSPDSGIRSQAIMALSAYGREEDLERITGCLTEPDMEVRCGAIAGLIKHYGIEGMFRAVGVLKELLASADEDERAAVAALFGRIGIATFYKPLIPLLQDESPRVRRLALRSAGALRVPELAGCIVPLLQHGMTRKDAIEALAAYDEQSLMPLLEPCFAQEPAPLHLPKVFERIATPSAFDKLLELYPAAGFEMRSRLLEALNRMLWRVQATEKQRARIEPLIAAEIGFYWQLTANLAGLALVEGYSDAAETGEQMRSAVIWRIFQWLALVHDPAAIRSVYANWMNGDARQQANAMEVIDQLTQGTIRIELGKIMNGANTASTANPASAAAPAKAGSAAGTETAGTAAADGGASDAVTDVNAATAATAAGAAGMTARLEEQLVWLNRLNDPWLRKVIAYAANPGESAELAEHMERIRLLRGFPLFQSLTGRELSELAAKLEGVGIQRGAGIFTEQDEGNSLYLVRSGLVGIYRGGARAAVRKAGEAFGQSGILVYRERLAAAVAEEDCRLWRLDSDDFYEAMFDRSSIAIEMMKLLSRRLRLVLSQQKPAERAPKADVPNDAPDHASNDAPDHAPDSAPNRPSDHMPDNAPDEVKQAAIEAAAASGGGESGQADSLLRRVLVLQKIDLFSHLSEDDIVQLAQMVEEVEYEAGEVVCRVGDYGDTLYGIIEGHVRVHRGDATFAVLGEGDCFGEMAIIDSGPRSADCTATAPTVLLQLHREQVFSLCFRNMEVLRSMMKVMGDRLKGMAG